MARRFTIYGGGVFMVGKQFRGLVAAHTKKRAAELAKLCFGISRYEFNGYWCETRNESELYATRGSGEGAWLCYNRWSATAGSYKPVKDEENAIEVAKSLI